MPSNCESDAPLVVKNVEAVPSGPTKENGPVEELLAATWNLTDVDAGCTDVNESVLHDVVAPLTGALSLTLETRLPEVWYVAGVT